MVVGNWFSFCCQLPRTKVRGLPIEPKDLVRWEGKIYRVKGTQNYGAYVLLDDGAEKPSPKNIKKVEFVFHEKMLYVID